MYVVTGDEMHQIDRYTMDEIGLNEEVLMENAGQAFFRELIKKIDKDDEIAILIGPGNNGGDGFVIGRLLKEAGFSVDMWLIPSEERVEGAALTHKNAYERIGYRWIKYSQNKQKFSELIKGKYDVIVDAMLGTGINGSVRPPYDEIIIGVNSSKSKVYSVDIPSGLPCTLEEHDEDVYCVKADETFTFQAHKISQFQRKTASFFGEVTVLPIGIPKISFEKIGIKRFVTTEENVTSTLPLRDKFTHKGKVGRALVIGGSFTMPGAAVLMTNACLRAGAGLTTLAVPTSIYPIITNKVTEATFFPVEDVDGEINVANLVKKTNMERFNSIAIGPGLGRKRQQQLFASFKDITAPLVLDADALFHLSKELDEWKNEKRSGETIITPHLGEMSLLTGISLDEIEKHRFEVTKEFAREYGMYIILKGANTLITTPTGEQWINPTGNPSLAKGGTGDVLTGIVTAFLLQHSDVLQALINAVYIHGKAADQCIQLKDCIAITASDIVDQLSRVILSLRCHS